MLGQFCQSCYIPGKHFIAHGLVERSTQNRTSVRNGTVSEAIQHAAQHALNVFHTQVSELDVSDCGFDV